MTPRDQLLALAVVVVWGLNFVFVKWGMLELPPLILSAARYIVILPVLLFVPRPRIALPILVGYGMFVGFGQFAFLYTALHIGMPAGLSSLVLQIQVFFSIALAVLFLGERPSPMTLLGALVAFLGIGVIATERLAGAALVPLLMTLAAAACWSVANLITKKAGKLDMLGFVVWSSAVQILPLLALSALVEGPGALPAALANLTYIGIGSALFTGYVSTIFGYGLWSVLLSRYPASVVTPYTLLVPIIGMASAALLLGESISVLEIVGSVLVFLGLLLNVFGPRLLRRQAA